MRGSVFLSSALINNNGYNKSFHTITITKIEAVASDGKDIGRTILENMFHSLAPSIALASMVSLGIVFINPPIINTAIDINVAVDTKIKPSKLFVNPNLSTIPNKGTIVTCGGIIIPKIKKLYKTPLFQPSNRIIVYDIKLDTNKHRATEPTVTIILFKR